VNVRRTRTCELSLRDGVIHGVFLAGAEVALVDAAENLAATAELVEGKARPALIDLRGLRSQSAEARAHLAGPEAAVALVIASPLSRMIGNFYLGFNRPRVPTRLFTDAGEAEQWLRGFL
jgi:hypothetical protein